MTSKKISSDSKEKLHDRVESFFGKVIGLQSGIL